MPAQLSFPSTLSRERHKSIIAFTSIKPKNKLASNASSFGVKPVLGHNDGGTVFLYMPDLGDRKYEQGFNSEGMGMLEKIISAFTSDEKGSSNFSQAAGIIASALWDPNGKLATDIANPHTTSRYEGPKLRTQSFTFELFPRNESELRAIRDIVNFFKINSSTRVGVFQTSTDKYLPTGDGNGLTGNDIRNVNTAIGNGITNIKNAFGADRLQYPDQWLIQEIITSPDKSRIMPTFRFGPAYCESVSITDAKDRPTFVTGDSISYTLKLDFVESTMLTSADIEAGA